MSSTVDGLKKSVQEDFAIAIAAIAMLVYFKLVPWIVVLITAILGALAYAIS